MHFPSVTTLLPTFPVPNSKAFWSVGKHVKLVCVDDILKVQFQLQLLNKLKHYIRDVIACHSLSVA